MFLYAAIYILYIIPCTWIIPTAPWLHYSLWKGPKWSCPLYCSPPGEVLLLHQGGGSNSNCLGQVHYCWVMHRNHSGTTLRKLYRDYKNTTHHSILKMNFRNWHRYFKIGSKSLEIHNFSNRCHSLMNRPPYPIFGLKGWSPIWDESVLNILQLWWL